MYHCLLPVDADEERTRAQADFVVNLPLDPAEIAATILHVLPRDDATIRDRTGFEGNESAVRAANRLEGYEIDVSRRIETGGPISTRILAIAESVGADQIVMAGRKRSDLAKVLLGSTVTSVMREADRPVVLVG